MLFCTSSLHSPVVAPFSGIRPIDFVICHVLRCPYTDVYTVIPCLSYVPFRYGVTARRTPPYTAGMGRVDGPGADPRGVGSQAGQVPNVEHM